MAKAKAKGGDSRQLGLGGGLAGPGPVRKMEIQRYAEGNLFEAPFWALNNRFLKPTRVLKDENGKVVYATGEDGAILINKETGKPVERRYPDPEDYKQTFVRTILRDGHPRTETWTVDVSTEFGWPSMTVFAVVAIVVDKAKRLGFKFQKVPITRGEIVRKLGLAGGGKDYALVEDALECAKRVNFGTRHAWLVPTEPPKAEKAGTPEAAGAAPAEGDAAETPSSAEAPTKSEPPSGPTKLKRVRAKAVGTSSIVKEFEFREESAAAASGDGEGGSAADDGPSDYVELGAEVWRSVCNGYLIGLDMAYFTALRSDGARRLYAYLDKRDGSGAPTYREALAGIAFHFGFARSSPSVVKTYLTPHLEVMKGILETSRGPKRFLEDYRFVRLAGGEEALEVTWPASRFAARGAGDEASSPGDEFRNAILDGGTLTENLRRDLEAALFDLDVESSTVTVRCVDDYHVARMRDFVAPVLLRTARAHFGRHKADIRYVVEVAAEKASGTAQEASE